MVSLLHSPGKVPFGHGQASKDLVFSYSGDVQNSSCLPKATYPSLRQGLKNASSPLTRFFNQILFRGTSS